MATDTKTDTIKDAAGNDFELKRTIAPEGVVLEQYVRKGEPDAKKTAEAESKAATERAQAGADADAVFAAAEAAKAKADAELETARIEARNAGGGYSGAAKTPHEYAQEAAAKEKAETAEKAKKGSKDSKTKAMKSDKSSKKK